ncbi:hypothetical protein [Streptomyces sp. NPDC088812]|uniref:hypothetical protein n=1 Tax=Streptomyces sp. NPDC088812 TaxID=3365905 RepID=UPI0037F7923C
MDTREASTLVFDAISYAVAGDAERAADTITTLGSQSDDNLMYGACCAIAEAGKLMLQKIYGEQAARPENGDMWVFEQLKPGALDDDPAKAFAMRFLVAYCNGDTATTLALFQTALHSDGYQYVDSVCALLVDVAGITRLAIDQRNT